MEWNKYQLEIFKNVREGQGHTIVEALAGTGKTKTIIEALKYIPPDLTWLLVAFNKKIAEELKLRAPISDKGYISTLHSLGLKSIGATFSKIKVDNDKLPNIIKKLIKDNSQRELRNQLEKAVNLSKSFLASSDDDIDLVMDEYDIEPADLEREEFIGYVRTIMDTCRSQYDLVDFSDMVWLPNVLNLKVPKFDRVFLDESQDTTKAQLGLVLQAVQPKPKTKRSKPEGRILAAGDPNQVLYAFGGVDINSMYNLKQKLNAKTLPLSITYRCPIAVVKEAQKIVPEFEAAPDAKEGKVAYISLEEMKNQAKPGCVIISRTNAPLIGLALHFIKNNIPANIQGRDIGDNLLATVASSHAKNIDKFIDYLISWRTKQIARLTKQGRDTTNAIDRVECLQVLADNVTSIQELKDNIKKLFSDVDDNHKILLSNTHKFKGLERDIVYMLLGTYRKNTQEEINLNYVCITRSKNELYFVVNKTR